MCVDRKLQHIKKNYCFNFEAHYIYMLSYKFFFLIFHKKFNFFGSGPRIKIYFFIFFLLKMSNKNYRNAPLLVSGISIEWKRFLRDLSRALLTFEHLSLARFFHIKTGPDKEEAAFDWLSPGPFLIWGKWENDRVNENVSQYVSIIRDKFCKKNILFDTYPWD